MRGTVTFRCTQPFLVESPVANLVKTPVNLFELSAGLKLPIIT